MTETTAEITKYLVKDRYQRLHIEKQVIEALLSMLALSVSRNKPSAAEIMTLAILELTQSIVLATQNDSSLWETVRVSLLRFLKTAVNGNQPRIAECLVGGISRIPRHKSCLWEAVGVSLLRFLKIAVDDYKPRIVESLLDGISKIPECSLLVVVALEEKDLQFVTHSGRIKTSLEESKISPWIRVKKVEDAEYPSEKRLRS